MIVAVFRSRLNVAAQDDYMAWATRMSELVADIPGYVSHKGYLADDGERVTIVEFESEEGLRIWATHAQHVAAKKKGRELFFTEYRVQVCNVMRDSGKKLTQAGKSN